MILSEYYLLKCFETSEYRRDFLSGENIYLNSTAHFWSIENAFQQDLEGLVASGSNGYLLLTKPGFEEVVKRASSVNEVLETVNGFGKIIGEGVDFSFRIDGYICCFYLLPKNDVSIENERLFFLNEEAKHGFSQYILNYCIENRSEPGNVYSSIFDANSFCNTFLNGMSQKGYALTSGDVEYRDLEISQRIKLYQNKEIAQLVFTKPVKYSYQKEFRIFVSKQAGIIEDHISESGIDFSRSIIGTFDFFNIHSRSE